MRESEMLRRVIRADGYRAFRGAMEITPVGEEPGTTIRGDWIYKPETGCWYHKTGSYPEQVCHILEVE